MSVCEICEVNIARFICRICGRYVCSEHFNSKKQVCHICLNALCEVCGKKLSITSCSICGKMICYSCSIKLAGVTRICSECFAKYKQKMNFHKYKSIKDLLESLSRINDY